MLKQEKLSFDYEDRKYVYNLRPSGAKCLQCRSSDVAVGRHYSPDFTIFPRGKLVKTYFWILEAKGKFTSKDRTKMLAVVKDNPTVVFRMMFMRDNRLNKNSEVYYSDWCKKHDIEYVVGLSIPREWLDGN